VTKTTLGRPAAAVVSTLFVAIATALSACSVAPTACAGATDAPIYLMDNTTARQIDPGTRLDWNTSDGIVLAAHAVPADLGDLSWASFAPVAGASSVVAFLSAPGSERTPGAWKQWGDATSIDTGVLLPAVWPGYLGKGAPAVVKASGGTFSMGIAFLDGTVVASAHVIAAHFTTITIDTDGSGAWTFANPAVCAAAPGAHTTGSLALDRVSSSVARIPASTPPRPDDSPSPSETPHRKEMN
jgi:hypothetical protein